jgi:hypothetical protein
MSSQIFTKEHLLWAPLVFASLHIVEEFVWPGGFKAWYQRYRGVHVGSITTRFLVIMNAAMLLACWDAAVSGRSPANLPLWMGMAGVLASNGIWHIFAAIRSKSYSPGVITGTLLYIPLAIIGYATWLRAGGFSPTTAAAAILAGLLYPLWSAGFHFRKSAHPEAA